MFHFLCAFCRHTGFVLQTDLNRLPCPPRQQGSGEQLTQRDQRSVCSLPPCGPSLCLARPLSMQRGLPQKDLPPRLGVHGEKLRLLGDAGSKRLLRGGSWPLPAEPMFAEAVSLLQSFRLPESKEKWHQDSTEQGRQRGPGAHQVRVAGRGGRLPVGAAGTGAAVTEGQIWNRTQAPLPAAEHTV